MSTIFILKIRYSLYISAFSVLAKTSAKNRNLLRMSEITIQDGVCELSSTSMQKRAICPYCQNCSSNVIGHVYLPLFFRLPVGKVRFDDGLSNDILLLRCKSCGLLYKDLIPSRKTLVQMCNDGEENRQTIWEYKSGNKYIIQRVQVVKKISRGKERHILDIGCHTGLFLRLAREAGFKTSGLDPSDVACAEHSNFVSMSFYPGFLEDTQIPKNSFDFITAWDVFEHFHDVKAALQRIYQSLKLGGYLLLETGDVSSFPARLRSANNWWYVSLLEHFNFFKPSSIGYILSDMNFRITTIDKVYHKSLDRMSITRASKALPVSLMFYISPELYRYLSKLKGASGQAARLPWKDHIFVIAQKC